MVTIPSEEVSLGDIFIRTVPTEIGVARLAVARARGGR